MATKTDPYNQADGVAEAPSIQYGGRTKPPFVLNDSSFKNVTASLSAAQLISAVRKGLLASELFKLKAAYDVSNDVLASMAGISKATLSRRKPEQRLSTEESDRIVRFARLFSMAIDVMGTEDYAREWMKTPQAALGDSTPLDYAMTEIGAREVEDLLGRIEHGVYS